MGFSLPAFWLGEKRGYLSDWVTQQWVRLFGRTVDIEKELWLRGLVGATREIGDSYFEGLASRTSGHLDTSPSETGLVEDFSVVKSPTFSPDDIHPKIRDFYEHTTNYKLDVWSQWCGIFKPFGWLLAVIFSRRLQQLNMPMSSLETSKGITSDVIRIANESGEHVGTGWLRKLVATDSVIYAGIYSICNPAKFDGRCMKVIFPLPNGNATVIMKPTAHPDGSLTLISSGEGFGEPGFYFIVQKNQYEAWVKYLHAMKESIHVYVDDGGELRADHVLKIWGAIFLKLHYRMQTKPRADKNQTESEIDKKVT